MLAAAIASQAWVPSFPIDDVVLSYALGRESKFISPVTAVRQRDLVPGKNNRKQSC